MIHLVKDDPHGYQSGPDSAVFEGESPLPPEGGLVSS
jgi:hypothetical protein